MTGDDVKNVALIGSSGGGTATLGHTDPTALLRVIHEQMLLCGERIAAACFVALDGGKGMDSVNELVDTATLYAIEASEHSITLGAPLECRVTMKGTLKDVNDCVKGQDEAIALAITDGRIHGLICVSCHTQLFRQTLSAAAATGIPVTGSGGSSLSQAAAIYGLTFTGNVGGSVASNTFSRAVSYSYALASYWKRPYQPWNSEQQVDIAWTSVLDACLPVFWGVCLAKFVLKTVGAALEGDARETVLEEIIFALENWALPTACAVIMATLTANSTNLQQQDLPLSSLIMASVLASTVCMRSVVSGLLAGWLVRRLTNLVLFQCVVANVPATMANLVTTGGTGCAVALLLLPVAPILRRCTSFLRWAILWTIVGAPSVCGDDHLTTYVRASVGFAWGCLCCYGSKVGWYHSYFLPAILIEMELGDASFLGAMDELTLVLVCAGICAGNLVARKLCRILNLECSTVNDTDGTLCRRGLYINLLCGDFIEVCYPFMERHPIINASGYVASGLATTWLVLSATSIDAVPKSLAYLPLPLSIALPRHEWCRMALASLIAAGIPFAATLVNSMALSSKRKIS